MRRWFFVTSVFALGCEGSIGDPSPFDPSDPESCRRTGRCESQSGPPETSAYPRLSHRQWENTVRDLFAWDALPGLASSFAPDARGTTLFDNDGTVLQVSPNHWEDYQSAAEIIAARVVADPAAKARATGGATDPREAYGAMLRRAFRRPPRPGEVDAYVALHAQGPTHYPDLPAFDAGLRLVLEAVLQSPFFLYRDEDGDLRDGAVTLDAHQLAARLSYALWDTMPDDTLFAAADTRALERSEGLREQAFRMLEDAKAREKIEAFHRQLFELETYDGISLEGFSADLGRSMRREAERFASSVILDDDGSLADLLTAPFSFVNEELAQLYGLSGVTGPELRRVELDPTQRAGLFTQPGFLVRKRGDAAPILRGVYLNLRVLCANLPEPPVFEPPDLRGTTRRERINSATGVGTCGETCHAGVINPIGFAFETFDDTGRWRAVDNGAPVDAVSSYWFGDEEVVFDGPVELMGAVAQSEMAHRCYAQNWMEFAFGRPLQTRDAATVESIAEGSLGEGWSVKEILVALVDSPSFRTRAPLPEEE